MSSTPWSPRRLDVEALARAQGELQGELGWGELPRMRSLLAQGAETEQEAGPPVHWQARGERRRLPDGSGQVWLHLQAQARAALTCQRCLAPVTVAVDVERDFRFVGDEAQAEREDADADEEVLAMNRRFDLVELVEDELLLALPLVPRHDTCPRPLLPGRPDRQHPGGDDESVGLEPEPRPNPFAVLARLKTSAGGDENDGDGDADPPGESR